MKGISICLTMKNRADLFRWSLESIARQTFLNGKNKVEVCIADGLSSDDLFSLIDRYSEKMDFVYAYSNRKKAYVDVKTNCPAADLNVAIKYLPTYDTIVKIDPEIVLKDEWLLEEMHALVAENPRRMYNARTHFTQGNNWYRTFEDIVHRHENNYLYAEGGPFSRSKFYFCHGISRTSFIDMGGIDERFCLGDGFDDTCYREHWKNVYGEYEYEITAQAIHLWHAPTPNHSSELYEFNRGQFLSLKDNPHGNFKEGEDVPWGNVNMLSKIYYISNGEIVKTVTPHEDAVDVDLPF